MYSLQTFAWLAASAIGIGAAVSGPSPAVAEDVPMQAPQQATEPAEQQSLQGTVIDAAGYLIQGEQALEQQQDPQQQQKQQQPYVLLTEQGGAYLIVERPRAQDDSDLQPPLQDPAQQPAPIEQPAQPEPAAEAEPDSGIRSPVRDRLAPRGSGGMRHQIAQRERERRWERHPGEWRDMEPQRQEQFLMDEPTQVAPAGAGEPQQIQQPSRVFQQLQVGQQYTLTGEVHERGGLRGIVIDEYGIEADGLEAPMEAPVSNELEQPQQQQDFQDPGQY